MLVDRSEQAVARERLGQILIGAGDATACAVEHTVFAGEHDDGCFCVGGILFDDLAQLIAIELGHHDVHQDQVRREIGDFR